MSPLHQQATQSVITLHQLYEKIFHGDGSFVRELVRHFEPDFQMVTPTGSQLTLAEVEALFTRLTGARKEVSITIEQCRVIAQLGQEVVIQFHELQQQGETHNHRICLALIDCSSTPPRWRYVQETLVAK